MLRFIAASSLVLSCHILVVAEAQTPDSQSVFTAADFERFAPRTALDMVEQIPGFSIDEEDEDSRGFGQASGNVLINGQRLSGKSNTPTDALGRISAANVERIEVLDGATLDIPGLSGQIVNVVAATDGISGTWSWRMRFRDSLPPAYAWIETSATGKRGDVTWTLGFTNDLYRGGSEGLENVFDGQGTITERREEAVRFIANEPIVTGSLEWTPGSGQIANLNARYENFNSNEREVSRAFPASDAPDRLRQFQFAEDYWEAELGADYEFGFGPGRLKAIGLYRSEHSPEVSSVFETAVDGSSAKRRFFDQTRDSEEAILRTEYGWSTGPGRDWQVSLEGALNSLEAESKGGRNEDGAPIDPATLPVSFAEVEEKRGETFVTHTRALSPKWTLQGSLGVEYSELVAGGDSETRTFTRPKGFVSATYAASDTLTVNARFERLVGQLDFFDFISSQNLSVETESEGNPDIVPEQSWRSELEIEKSFGSVGAGTLTLYHEDIEDVFDRVPFGANSEGPGNLDSATRFGAEIDATVRFDGIGLNGLQFTLDGDIRESSVDDPVTGETRRINEDLIMEIETALRHDIPNTDWAWGLTFEREDEASEFRLDEIRYREQRPSFIYGFVEHKDLWGMTGTVFVANLLDQDDQFTRQVFTPRRDGELRFVEDRSRNFGPILTLRLRGTF